MLCATDIFSTVSAGGTLFIHKLSGGGGAFFKYFLRSTFFCQFSPYGPLELLFLGYFYLFLSILEVETRGEGGERWQEVDDIRHIRAQILLDKLT